MVVDKSGREIRVDLLSDGEKCTLAMFGDFQPKFVKRFGEIGTLMKDAFRKYSEEVKAGSFPAAEHTFKIEDEIIEKLY